MLTVANCRSRFLGSSLIRASAVASLCVVGSTQSAFAQGQPPANLPIPQVPAADVPPVTIPVYSLSDCIRVALDKQPAVGAARASLAAKITSRNYVTSRGPLTVLVAPDIEVRKKQSLRGVDAANAVLLQVESETAYAVTRTYFTAIYARMQFDVAAEVVDNLKFYRNLVSDIVKGGGQADITQSTLDRLDVYVSLATTKQVDAEEGVKRALAALREAMGKGFDCDSFQLADIRLPELTVVPERCDIITQALARRGEMMAVLLAAEVFRLEVDAQGKHCFKPLVGTFALTSDIHSVPIPPGMRNGEYRPGAIAFEMPTNLAGDKRTRQSVACSYSERADAVVAKTRELISLEAEDGYLKWVESTRKVVSGRDAANVARKLSRQTREDANRGAKIKQDEILITDVLAGQATAAFHEAVFQQVLALAGLERITAGGFISGLTVPPAVVAK